MLHAINVLLVQIRAGESEAESQDYTLTNTVYKTNMSSGLSKQGKRQVGLSICKGCQM